MPSSVSITNIYLNAYNLTGITHMRDHMCSYNLLKNILHYQNGIQLIIFSTDFSVASTVFWLSDRDLKFLLFALGK